MKLVYISGPITGHSNFNEPAFREAEDVLRARGDDPIVPHDLQPHSHAGLCPGTRARASAPGPWEHGRDNLLTLPVWRLVL